MEIRREETKRERALNILLFRETKPHDVSLQPQRESENEREGAKGRTVGVKRHHTLKRVSAFKRHAAV